jgi:hypothetical protein
MQRLFITIVNCTMLALVFIGVPAVAGERFWDWQISSVPVARELVLWGLALALAVNAGAALFLVKGRKEQKLCWEWAAVFAALLGAEYAFIRGWLNFAWLRQIRLRLQKSF